MSTSEGRTFDRVLRRAKEHDALPEGDALLAATSARLSGITIESGLHQYFDRPPLVGVGVTTTAVLVVERKRLVARAFLPLLTHAQRDFDRIQLQWVTATDAGCSISLHGIASDEVSDFWSCLKQQRDDAWLGHSRAHQVDLSWLSCTRPGAIWRNETGATRDGFTQAMAPFLAGEPAPHNPLACSYVTVPTDCVTVPTDSSASMDG